MAEGKTIQINMDAERKKSVQPSSTLKNLGKNIVKLGKCRCGKIIVRFDAAVSHAACTCTNDPILVPLTVSISRDRYETAKRLAKEMEADGSGSYEHLLQGLLNDVFEVESEDVPV